MAALWISWLASAAAIVIFCLWLGHAVTGRATGLLIDTRGRYSLTRVQVSLWTVVIVSLMIGVFVARLTVRGIDPLGFSIPGPVLGALGLSIGSTVLAAGVKAYKNATRAPFVAANAPDKARFAQVFLVEEGATADETVDVAKVQNFIITLFLVGAYAALAVHTLAGWGPGAPVTGPAEVTSLPDFNPTFLALLAISHAGYLAGKLPTRGAVVPDDTPALSLALRNEVLQEERSAALRAGLPADAASRRKASREQARRELRDRAVRTAPARPSESAASAAGHARA